MPNHARSFCGVESLKTFSVPEKTPCCVHVNILIHLLCSREHLDTLGFDGNYRDIFAAGMHISKTTIESEIAKYVAHG